MKNMKVYEKQNVNGKYEGLTEEELSRISAGSGTDTDSRRRPGDGTDDGTYTYQILTASSSQILVPNVIGKDVKNAISLLMNLGLTIETIYIRMNKPEGTIVITNPMPGTTVPKGGKVTLQVSSGE